MDNTLPLSSILPPESEEDNIEYKRLLSYTSIDNLRIDSLVTQMRWRVKEGSGQAYYYLGVNDNGTIYGLDSSESKETLQVFKQIVKLAQVDIVSISKLTSGEKIYFKAIIKEKCSIRPEIRVIVIGPENSGKTTFVSGLVHAQPDNGQGYLRNMLLTHKHELYSGKSNSLTIKTIGSVSNTNLNYTFIDTPANILENKIYLEKLIGISNFGIVVTAPGSDPSAYINELVSHSLDFIVINTKTSTNLETKEKSNQINLNLCEPIPTNFLSELIGSLGLNCESQTYPNPNTTFVLKTLYSGDCLYLLTCVQVSGVLNLSDTIYFENSDITGTQSENSTNFLDRQPKGTIESIQYMGCSVDQINLNVTFTCFIKTNQIIKKLKGNFFYST